ncbi:MAG TPA: hypothetical protein VMF06_23500 [Candidatus Limnocylindria bacterium]|nr:hypothetical protein [Candidatus Limnocylindria bacterium]
MSGQRRLGFHFSAVVQAFWLAVLLVAGGPLFAATNQVTFQSLGEWPGYQRGLASDVKVSGQYAYVAVGGLTIAGGLTIVDMTDKANPVVVGACDTTRAAIGLELRGDYAIVGTSGGLDIIDIRDPAHPVRTGAFADDKSIYGFAVLGNYAYLATGETGVDIVNISDPAHPVPAGNVTSALPMWGMKLVGSIGYMVEGAVGGVAAMEVFDFSDPAAPFRTAFFTSLKDFHVDVEVADGFVYVAARNWGLQIFNSAGTNVSTLPLEQVTAVQVEDHLAYIVGSTGRLWLYDVSNPAHPALVGTCLIPKNGNHIAVAGDHAFISSAVNGLAIVDTHDPTLPVALAGAPYLSGNSTGVRMNNGLAYVADGPNGLQVVDLANPQQPARIGGLITAGEVASAKVVGSRLYLAEDVAGMEIADVGVPSAPVVLGRYFPTPAPIRALDVEGNVAYAVGPSGLHIFNVTNPATPKTISGPNGSTSFQELDVRGAYAYFATAAFGLQVYDVSTPSKPVRVGQGELGPQMTAVQVAGGMAYVAAGNSGLLMVDVTNPTQPVTVGAATNIVANSVKVLGEVAYVLDKSGYLWAISVSDPTRPTVIGSFLLGAGATDFDLEGNLACISMGARGVRVVEFTYTPLPAPPSITAIGSEGITAQSAIIRATINPHGLPSTAAVQFGTTTNFGGQVPMVLQPADGTNSQDVATPLNGLISGVQYYYRGVAASSEGTTLSATRSFKTLPIAPSVTTLPVTNITTFTAEMAAQVSFSGDTTVSLRCLGDGGYDKTIVLQLVSTNGLVTRFPSSVFDGLTPGFTYRYYASASNAAGVSVGTTLTFSQPVQATLTVNSIGRWTDPVKPVRAGASGIKVIGDLAYLTGGFGLKIINVRDPAHPVLVGALEFAAVYNGLTPSSMVIQGDDAFVAVASGFYIVDIRNPAAPVLAGKYAWDGLWSGLAISGNYAFMSNKGYQVVVIDFSQRDHTTYIGNVGHSTQSMDQAGNILYAAVGPSGLQFFDLRDAPTLKSLGSISAGYSVDVVRVANQLAYVAGNTSGLAVIDVASVAHPRVLGELGITWKASGLDISGKYVFVANASAGVTAIDLSFVAQPVVAGVFPTGGTATGIQVIGDLIYVANGAAGLQILQIQNYTGFAKPLVSLLPPEPVGFGGVTLHGLINPLGSLTQASFETGSTTNYTDSQVVQLGTPDGTTNQPVAATLAGLAPGSTIHYRLIAANSVGQSASVDDSVRVPSVAPVVVGMEMHLVSSNGATVEAWIGSGGEATSVDFQVQGPGFADWTVFNQIGVFPGTGIVNVRADLTALVPGGTYRSRVVVTNINGSNIGPETIFVTTAVPSAPLPAILEYGVTSVSSQSAALIATINPNGLPTAGKIQFGADTNYGSEQDLGLVGTDWTTNQTVQFGLGNLLPGTVYHGNIVVTNSAGSSSTGDFLFTTASLPKLGVAQTDTGLRIVVQGEPLSRHALQHAVNLQPPIIWQTSQVFIEDSQGSATIELKYGGSTDFWRTVPLE